MTRLEIIQEARASILRKLHRQLESSLNGQSGLTYQENIHLAYEFTKDLRSLEDWELINAVEA